MRYTPFSPKQSYKRMAQIRNFERGRLKAAYLLLKTYIETETLDRLYEDALIQLDSYWIGTKELKKEADLEAD